MPGLGAGHECVVGFVMGNTGASVECRDILRLTLSTFGYFEHLALCTFGLLMRTPGRREAGCS